LSDKEFREDKTESVMKVERLLNDRFT